MDSALFLARPSILLGTVTRDILVKRGVQGWNFSLADSIHESRFRDRPVTQQAPHSRLDDELKHSWTIITSVRTERNLRGIAARLAVSAAASLVHMESPIVYQNVRVSGI